MCCGTDTKTIKQTTTSASNMLVDPKDILIAPTMPKFGIQVPKITARGRVVSDGMPLELVHVYVNPTEGTYTDSNGNFSLPGVEPGELLHFSSIGFETELRDAEAQMGTIGLTEQVYYLDPIDLTPEEKEPPKVNTAGFPWEKLLIGVAVTVTSGLIIRAINKAPVKTPI